MRRREDEWVHRVRLSPEAAALVAADAARFAQTASALRLVFAGTGALAIVANWSSNTRETMIATTTTYAVALGFACFTWWHGRTHDQPAWLTVSAAAVDMSFVTAFSASGLYNWSGAYETLLAPLFLILYPLFLVLTALTGSVFATIFAGLLAATERMALLQYIVGRGLVGVSDTARYGEPVVGLADQYTIVGFLGVLGGLFAAMAYLLRKESIRSAEETLRTLDAERKQANYRKYLSANVADYVMSNPGALTLGGSRRIATVMFVDLRDFTAFSERESPEVVVEVLNRVFSALVAIVFRHGGTLDKFLGDGLMAVFGVPQQMDDDRGQAVAAALEMVEAVRSLDRTGAGQGTPLQIGIGIAHGEVIAGNVGSPERMEFTVIGDTANYASRLQALTKDFARDIVVSESVHDGVRERFATVALPPVRIKGKSGEPKTWAVTGRA